MLRRPESSTKQALRFAKQWSLTGASWLLGVVAICALLGGIGVFGWQVYHLVSEGVWRQISVVDSLSRLDIRVRAPVPNSWTIVHSFVEWLPLSATGLVGGTFLAIFASGLRDAAARAHPKPNDVSPISKAPYEARPTGSDSAE